MSSNDDDFSSSLSSTKKNKNKKRPRSSTIPDNDESSSLAQHHHFQQYQKNNDNDESNKISLPGSGKKGEEGGEENVDDEDYSLLIQALNSALPIDNIQTTTATTTTVETSVDHRRGSGVGKFQLDTRNYDEMRKLQDIIMTNVIHGVTWGEGNSVVDPRRRRYAFLPNQKRRLINMGIRIETPETTNIKEHEDAINYSSMTIQWSSESSETKTTAPETTKDEESIKQQQQQQQQTKKDNDNTDQNPTNNNKSNTGQQQQVEAEEKVVVVSRSILDALIQITNQLHEKMEAKYKKYVTIDNLIAVQPNHHNGALYLPAHLDFPRADGFGIVIATIGIMGVTGSNIVFIDDGDEDKEESTMSWSFPFQDGECYFLCGNARNKCLHGVVCANPNRSTLNLRYGLHSSEFAYDEIDRHWP